MAVTEPRDSILQRLMKVSVVMPSLNQAPFIGEAIGSVLAQDGAELELIVQDGGSTDGTADVVRSFGDPRIRFSNEPDRGQSHALNRGIEKSTGEWILELNADDRLASDAFASARPLLDQDGDMVYGDYAYIDAQGNLTRRIQPPPELSARRLLVQGNYVFCAAAFLQRDLFRQWGGFSEHLHYAMDYDFYLRIAPHVRARHCASELAYFRLHSAGNTIAKPWLAVRETFGVRRAHGAFSGSTLGPALFHQGKQALDALTRPVRRRA
jgi:glycosyltransferase involved in cell wall biosynthesis